MTKIIAQYMRFETAALGLVELVLSFVIVDAFLNLPGSLETLGSATAPLPVSLTNLATAFALITAAAGIIIGLYRPEVCIERRRLVVSAGMAGIVAFPVLLLVSNGFHINLTRWAVGWLLVLLLICQAAILATHLAFAATIRRNSIARRVLVLGSGPNAARMMHVLRSCSARLFEPMSTVALPALSPRKLRAQGIWAIVVADPIETAPSADRLLDSKLRGVRVLSAAGFCEKHLGRVDLETADARRLVVADGFTRGHLSSIVKRCLDVTASLVLIVLTLPVTALIALLIKLDSPGPILYHQQRVGLYGAPFTLLKFRSMRVDAELGGAPRWAQQKDPRATRVGRFMRSTRIDELPQLINVLRGEMSMIGPRPERPHFVDQLEHAIPLYRQRSYVKPGLTGWAQVNYPYGASIEDAREKLAYDLYYVKNRGFLLDLLILLATIRVILSGEGAR